MLNPKTKERELAYVVTIDGLRPIEGADKVELAIVGGWHIMVRKGQFKVGGKAIYFEIDSKVPEKEPFMFLKDKHFKIKTQKYFKGTVLSQGLLMSFEDFDWDENKYEVGAFLTNILSITYAVAADNDRKASTDKYARMRQRHFKLFKENAWARWLYDRGWGKKLLFLFLGKKRDKSGWPRWVVKTDEERVQNLGWMFPDAAGTQWVATEKIDGTSTTFTLRKKDFFVCSRNVVFDKPEKECFYDTNVYLEMAKKYNLEAVLKDIKSKEKLDYVTIQGETYGGKIQNRDYNLKEEHDLKVFNLIFGYKDGEIKRFNPIEMTKYLAQYNIPCVPIVNENYILPETCDEVLADCGGASALDGGMREGLVFRSLDGKNSFKAVDNEFLIRYHN